MWLRHVIIPLYYLLYILYYTAILPAIPLQVIYIKSQETDKNPQVITGTNKYFYRPLKILVVGHFGPSLWIIFLFLALCNYIICHLYVCTTTWSLGCTEWDASLSLRNGAPTCLTHWLYWVIAISPCVNSNIRMEEANLFECIKGNPLLISD